MSSIEVKNVIKEYRIYKRETGFSNALKSLFYRRYDTLRAVDGISFSIEKGELVGYIGPNGAGKSTTIKMLAGVLVPTSGSIYIDGRIPYKNRKENAMHMGIVFGQRSQLFWDLPVEETFVLYKKMYRIDDKRFKHNVDYFIKLLDMEGFIKMPVRQLSLGQKMRADLAISMLHDPDIVYLDEPTIGLDVVAKGRIRKFIREVNREKKTTFLLTTHDMDDIEQICERIIMINQGRVIYDGNLDLFKEKHGKEHVMIVDFADDEMIFEDPILRIIKEEGSRRWISFDKRKVGIQEAINRVTSKYRINDFSLREPEIEDIVRDMYENAGAEV
ncbi:MAG: ATP-binding cassette domain-containing protein [Ruminiclostridium sp.]|nr:ATP-binding cassette domain-containing protein [Ruminiclostridium sp.]